MHVVVDKKTHKGQLFMYVYTHTEYCMHGWGGGGGVLSITRDYTLPFNATLLCSRNSTIIVTTGSVPGNV